MEPGVGVGATEDIDISTDLTPPLTPLSFSLHTDSPDFSTALRLLLLRRRPTPSGRISGLLSNRHKLTCQNDELSHGISLGAESLATALANHRGETEPNDGVLEEATVALCAVLTNAVEVQDNEGRNIGIAVFGPTFSWINHSCSPNACYRTFSSSSSNSPESKLRIAPLSRNSQQSQIDSGVWCSSSEFTKGSSTPQPAPSADQANEEDTTIREPQQVQELGNAQEPAQVQPTQDVQVQAQQQVSAPQRARRYGVRGTVIPLREKATLVRAPTPAPGPVPPMPVPMPPPYTRPIMVQIPAPPGASTSRGGVPQFMSFIPTPGLPQNRPPQH